MSRTLLEFARSCGGTLRGTDRAYTGVSTDTRTLKAGELFVALRGPRFNANDFVAAAEAAGAAGAVVDSPVERPLAQVVVPDTQAALTTSSAAWRAQFAMPIVGVAGSNGKTTVKEMIAAILERAGNTLATRGNLNNHIGVPLTLHRLDGTHRYAVIEIGANRAGEVADLVKLARPTVGLITNAGAEHLEGFGSMEGVARAEGEMVAGLDDSATAVINADDAFAGLWRGMARGRISTFGVAQPADFSATDIAYRDRSQRFRHAFHSCVRRPARCPSSCTWRAGTTSSTRCARRRRPPPRARRSTTSAPALPQCARFLADCSSKPRRVAPGLSTILITPIPAR